MEEATELRDLADLVGKPITVESRELLVELRQRETMTSDKCCAYAASAASVDRIGSTDFAIWSALQEIIVAICDMTDAALSLSNGQQVVGAPTITFIMDGLADELYLIGLNASRTDPRIDAVVPDIEWILLDFALETSRAGLDMGFYTSCSSGFLAINSACEILIQGGN
jgi:hypothetical protein